MRKLFVALLATLAFHAKAQEVAKSSVLNVQRFRVALNGGFSYMTAKISPEVSPQDRNYISGLKSGYHYGIDAAYFVKSWGLGAKFSQFKSSNSGLGTFEGNTVSVSNHLTTTFIGPSVSGKKTSASNIHTFVFALGMGYLGYRDNSLVNNVPIKITGGTFGAAIDFGYDIRVAKYLALGAQLSMVGGSLGKANYESVGGSFTQKFDDDRRENLSRLDISLGARFNF